MEDPLATEIEQALPGLIDAFYDRVRKDPELGPVFNDAIEDWDHHLELLVEFWSSVMLGAKGFRGNPMQAHLKHVDRIAPDMFASWLDIWNEVTARHLGPSAAAAIQAKAARIGQSLNMALHYRPDHTTSNTPVEQAPSTPYRSTPVFTSQTLPAALRAAHSTKAGVWGVIRVLEGRLRYRVEAEAEAVTLSPGVPGLVRPQELHHVEPVGEMRMQVDFYDHAPRL